MDWQTDVKPIVTSMVRQAMTGAAGILGTWGVFNSDQQTQFISVATAAVLWAGSAAWSAWQKRHQKAKVVEAAATGVVK